MDEDAALDDEFKRIVVEMKPHARSLPQRSDERHKVTLWIKKLLGLKTQRSERNAYAKLLLHMLKVRRLEAPFLDSPPPGSLKMPETMHSSRSPSPNELDSLLMSSPEDVLTSCPPLQSHDPDSRGSRMSGTDTTSRQRRTHTHRPTKSNHSTSHTHIMNERMSPKHRPRTSADTSNPLTRTSKRVQETAVFSSSSVRHSSVHDSGTSSLHTMVGRDKGWKSAGAGMDDKTSVRLWSGELSSSSVPETSFHPKLTSTFSPSKEGGSKHRPISTDSLDSHLLEQELSLSDVSTNDDVSDVAALLQSRPKPAPPQSPTGKGSHFSSYTPQVSFTIPLSQSPRKLDISRELLQAREVELKVKSAETQFQEEKLWIQRQHEDSLKHILDRKNNELEDLRSEHRVKVHQLESQCKKLERKVSQLEWECGQLREQRDHHATEQRQSSHYHKQQLQAEFYKKLHAAITESEREKLSLEQSHSRQLQRVLEESRAQVAKMEAEYSTQTKTNSEVIAELEGRVQELTREAESMAQAHSRLAQEKVALERKHSSLETELHEAHEISSRMEGELAEVRQDRESQLRQLRNKMEQSVQSLQHQHSIQDARAAEQVTQLEQQVSHWRDSLEEAKRRHEQQTSELQSSHQQQLWDKDLKHEKQVGVLKAEMEQRDLQAREKRVRLESSLRECEDQLVQLRTTQELQSQQAERAIEDFKAQVERQTNEMFEQMRGELEQVEEDLVHSRALREKEARESMQQRQEDRQKAEKELSELRLHHDLTVSQLRRDHQCELETLRREQEMAKELALAKLSSTLAEVEAQARAKATHSTKLISSLDDQVRHLQQQLEERETRHARELVEVKRSLEEEKLTTIRIHESAISKLKSQLERQKTKIREEHRAELDTITNKHSHRVQQLEHDFAMRMAQTSETISSLQSQMKFLQEDLERQKCSYEDQFSTMQQRSEEERDSIKQHHHTVVMSLQQEAEASLTTVTQLEERIAHLQVENESKLSHLRLQYESRMKGMMPLAVKQEYEDTIKSLKAQVNILSQRATILQEELDRRRPSTSRITTTPLPTFTTHSTLTKNKTATTISG